MPWPAKRVDRVVALLADLSRSVVARLVVAGDVTLDGDVVASASRRVVEGEMLGVSFPDEVDPHPTPDASIELIVRYEDPHVVVIDKAPGLVVHPGPATTTAPSSTRWCTGIRKSPMSGKSTGRESFTGSTGAPRACSWSPVPPLLTKKLVRQMSAHEPERIYTALGWGHPESDSGTIDAPIGRSPRHPTRMAVSEQGRRAVTHYRVDARYTSPRDTCLLTCRLETGRTHQIRVHLRAIGHPVVGDRDYDGGRPGLDPGRPFLHAGELRFVHPVTGDLVAVSSPLPADLVACLADCD